MSFDIWLLLLIATMGVIGCLILIKIMKEGKFSMSYLSEASLLVISSLLGQGVGEIPRYTIIILIPYAIILS